VGVVNLKNIGNNQAEAGIFIGDTAHLNSIIPILATVSIMEFAFDDLKLKTLKAKIAVNNVKAILFNESIGYIKQEHRLDNDFNYYETNQSLFIEATKNIRNTLDKL
jgi:RimJ/RimL family protein N-acetyltransferase